MRTRRRLVQAPPPLIAVVVERSPLCTPINDNADVVETAEIDGDPPLLLALMEGDAQVQHVFDASEVLVEQESDPLSLFPEDEAPLVYDDAEFDGEDYFVLGSPPDLPPAPTPVADDADKVVVAFTSADPPFDPPGESAVGAIEEEDVPFDAPDAAELEQGLLRTAVEEIDESEPIDELVLRAERKPSRGRETGETWRSVAPMVGKPVPPIVIHAAWDRPETGALLETFASDPRMARADISLHRGGVDGATVAANTGEAPDLIIVDSTLSGAELLSGLDRLRSAAPFAQVIVVGAANDIGLLRELTARGVSQYIVAPTRAEHLLRVVCTMYADFDRSRTIAVIGARGGVGASTIAYNIAWSIAERQHARTALVDLDLAFGAAGFSAKDGDPRSLAEILKAPEDEDVFDRAALARGERLHVVPAPALLGNAPEFGIAAVERVMRCARRASPYVVLDLPHMWSSWISHVLERADEVVIVATPELASLRNTENLLRAIEGARPERNGPCVLLAQTGVPKRPEILLKEFSGSVRSPPVAMIPFDPALFGTAAASECALATIDPNAKAVKTIEELAWSLSGRDPNMVRAKVAKRPLAPIQIVETPTPRAPSEPAPRALTAEIAETALKPVVGTEERTESEAAPVDLAVEAPLLYADYASKAREAMETELYSLQVPRMRSRFGVRMMALAALVFSIGLVGNAWRMRDMAAAAAQPQEAAAASPRPEAAPVAPSDPAADFTRALTLIESGLTQEGISRLVLVAEAGHAPAQHRLALMYEHGFGVPADVELARKWTERAAVGGEPRAMHDLGVYYARGDGGAQDDATAFRWFRQAAELGVSDSQYNLGIMYERGRGVEASAQEALFWFMLAASQGDAEAVERVETAERGLAAFDLEQARVRAQAFQARFTPVTAETPQPPATAATPAATDEAPAETPGH